MQAILQAYAKMLWDMAGSTLLAAKNARFKGSW
jgi:hypothetical protein